MAGLSMEDVRAATGSNGLEVASLFCGCGGSSVGYRLAGFSVVYANEFEPEVARVYGLNMDPSTRLHVEDVREVHGEDICSGLGELDVLDGSPPCQDWSMMGNRDFGARASLYDEFVRLVGEVRPRAFVAENVTGIVMGDAKPRFAAILASLRGHGYKVAGRVLDGSALGVAQERKRVVLIGFREDQGLDPASSFPVPGARTSLRDAGVGPLVVEEGHKFRPSRRHVYLRDREWPEDSPCATITTRGPGPLSWSYVRVREPDGSLRRVTEDDVRRVCGFPEGFDVGGSSFAHAALVYGNAVPPPMALSWAAGVRDQLLSGERSRAGSAA